MSIEKNYKPQEISTLLDVQIKTVYRWIKSGELKASRFGPRRIRVYQTDLNSFTQKRV